MRSREHVYEFSSTNKINKEEHNTPPPFNPQRLVDRTTTGSLSDQIYFDVKTVQK